MHLGPAAPRGLGDGVGNLLKPRAVRAATVVEMERWIGHEDGRASGTAELGSHERRCRNPRAERDFLRGDGAPHPAMSQRFGPEIVEAPGGLRPVVKRLPLAGPILVEIS